MAESKDIRPPQGDSLARLARIDPSQGVNINLESLRLKINAQLGSEILAAEVLTPEQSDFSSPASNANATPVAPAAMPSGATGGKILEFPTAVVQKRFTARSMVPFAAAAAAVVAVTVGGYQLWPRGPLGPGGLPPGATGTTRLGQSTPPTSGESLLPLVEAGAGVVDPADANTIEILTPPGVKFKAANFSARGSVAKAWTLSGQTAVTAQRVESLARELGLAGSAQQQGEKWVVTGANASLSVSTGELGTVTYRNTAPAPAVTCPPTTGVSPRPTGNPTTPVNPTPPQPTLTVEPTLPTPGPTVTIAPTAPPTGPTHPAPTITITPDPVPSTATPPVQTTKTGGSTTSTGRNASAIIFPAGQDLPTAVDYSQAVARAAATERVEKETPGVTQNPEASPPPTGRPAPTQSGTTNPPAQTVTPQPGTSTVPMERRTDCPELQPAPPGAGEARSRAVRIARAGGIAETGSPRVAFTSTSTTVHVPVLAGGAPTGREWTVTFGPAAVVQRVSGSVAQLSELGDYEVVSPIEAVARLNDPKFGALSATVDKSPSGGVQATVPKPLASGAEVQLVAATLTSTPVRAANGATMVVPAYKLTDAQGRTWAVLAVADQQLKN